MPGTACAGYRLSADWIFQGQRKQRSVLKETVMDICAVCAWRSACQKKFSVSGKDLRCPDFSRDVTIKEQEKDQDKEKEQVENDIR